MQKTNIRNPIETDRTAPTALRLDPLGIAILSFLQKEIGYSTKPKLVPLVKISKIMGCSYEQAKYRIKLLKKAGLLETWTTKHPTHYKQTYFRLPYLPSFWATFK